MKQFVKKTAALAVILAVAGTTWWFVAPINVDPTNAMSLLLILTVVAIPILLGLAFKRKVVDEKPRVLELLARVKESKCTRNEYRELDYLIRDHFKMMPIPVRAVDESWVTSLLVDLLEEERTAMCDITGEQGRSNTTITFNNGCTSHAGGLWWTTTLTFGLE